MSLDVGSRVTLNGNVTKLFAIGAKEPGSVEIMLGYGKGRLARGYWICLLSETLSPADFQMEGNTLNSGGKLGLPAHTKAADDQRTSVHSRILADYGSDAYVRLQQTALKTVTAIGRDRLVKVVPVIRHSDAISPAAQYPMGGGSLQWRLTGNGKLFYVAAFVDASAKAQTPDFIVSVATGARLDDRTRLFNYLANVPG